MGYKLMKIESGGAQQERRITHKIDIRSYPECDFSSNCAQSMVSGDIRTVPRAAEIPGTGTDGPVPISLHRIVAPICHGIFSRERLACCTLTSAKVQKQCKGLG